MGERAIWNKSEVELLIQVIRDHNILTALDGKRYRNGDVYKTLVPLFKEHGFTRTGDQLRTKWKALQLAYRKAKAANNKSGSRTANCPYYEALDQILGHRPNVSLVSQGVEAAVPFNSDMFQLPEGVEEITVTCSPYSMTTGDSSSSSASRSSSSLSDSLATPPVSAASSSSSPLLSDRPSATPGPSRGAKRRAGYAGSLANVSEQITRTREVASKASGDFITALKEEFAEQRRFDAKEAKRAQLSQANLQQVMMGQMFASMGMMRQMPRVAAHGDPGTSSSEDFWLHDMDTSPTTQSASTSTIDLTLNGSTNGSTMVTQLKVTSFFYVTKKNPPRTYVKHGVEFTIKDYTFVNNKMYKAPFRLRDDENNLEANIILEETEENLSVYIQFEPEDQDDISGKLKIFFRHVDGPAKLRLDCSMVQATVTPLGWGGSCLKPTNIQTYIHSKDMAIVCEIYLDLPTNTKPLMQVQNQMSKDFKHLLATEEFSDVTLKVGDQELRAHKFILSARSPVFNAMFKNYMTEIEQGIVEITDMEFLVLKSVLNYIYTDYVEDFDALAEELLPVAEKYQLDDLKEKCGHSLSNHLTVHNAARRFILAYVYREEHLKARAMKFINRYRKEVFQTEDWQDAKENYSKALAMAFL